MFMGLERNGPAAVCVALARCAALIAVIVLVRGPEDGVSASAIVGTTSLLAAFGLLVYLRYNFGVGFRRVPLGSALNLLRGGRTVFLGNIAVYLYRDVNVLLVGAIGAGPTAVSVYSLAEKIVKGAQAAARPLNQMLLPKAIRELRSKSGPDVAVLRRLVALLLPQLAIVVSVLVFGAGAFLLLSDEMAFLQNVPNIGGIVLMASIMSPAVLFGVGNFILGSVGLNNLGASTRLLRAIVYTGLINLGACTVLAATFGGTGAAFAFVLSELLLLLMILRTYTTAPGSPPADSRSL
jgi:PST family polysaccharide transporter